MSRDSGLLNLSANFEVQNAAPLDARQKTALKADLFSPATFGVYSFSGMTVSVFGDTAENNGLYVLRQTPSTVEANWSKIVLEENVLTKTNTTAFTPTQDYQPATKKYVDDNIGIGGGEPINLLTYSFQDEQGNVIFRDGMIDSNGNTLTHSTV